ncbi:lysine transporter LysE [Acinetobacter proteolyticus]|uniref:LysE family translocator n=1 Tax=Acinetobacter proteolyticus TaxID=1776741 RepID=UPI00086351EB|nr:LysE family translocator [Acinetobacter proteolyticus]OEY96761.1 lysine transporter LysE [Acinetobacter proteolyticus]
MPISILISMFIFSFTMSISPGPINITILSTSLIHGFKKTLPFISGATLGFSLLLIFLGFGFSQTISHYPIFFKILECIGALFIFYIGQKIIFSKPEIELLKNISIASFADGFLLQWLNPKAWIACLSGISLFSSLVSYHPLILFILIYFITCYICLMLWGISGYKLAKILTNPHQLKILNILMGGSLIILSIYMLIKLFWS